MGRRRDHISVGDRAWINTGRHQARHMSHINQKVSTNGVGDFSKFTPVHNAAVCTKATDNQLRSMLKRHRHQLVVVDFTRCVVDAVLNRVINFPRKIDARTVCEVSTIGKAHPHDSVTGLQKRVEHSNIRARS